MSGKENILFFSESYITLENALYLIDRYCDASLTIICMHFDSYQLLLEIKEKKKLDHLTLKIFKVNIPSSSIFSRMLIIRNFLKSFYIKELSNIKASRIYYSTQYYAPYTYYFLRKLRNNNTLVFIAPQNYPEYSPLKTISLKQIARIIYLKLIYGKDITFKRFYTREMVYLPDIWVKKNSALLIDRHKRKQLVNEGYLYSKYNIWKSNYKVLFFDTPFQREGVKYSKTLKEDFRLLLSILNKYYKKSEIGIKLHPGEDALFKEYDKYGAIIPSRIMGQFLAYSDAQIIISFWTTLFFKNTAGKNISLISLVNFLPEDLKEKRKNYLLERSVNEIRFPKKIDDFEELIQNR